MAKQLAKDECSMKEYGFEGTLPLSGCSILEKGLFGALCVPNNLIICAVYGQIVIYVSSCRGILRKDVYPIHTCALPGSHLCAKRSDENAATKYASTKTAFNIE